MCGIAGFTNQTGESWDRNVIDRMVDSLTHRGPDDRGILLNGFCALGMRRLAIIDLAYGHQPISTSDETLTIVFNGEIYNYRTIMKELEHNGRNFQTHSDTETILLAYKEWGADCLSYLRGMFSFVIFDRRDNSLFIARDRLGIKPLYYTIVGKELIFASEIKAILEHPLISKEINPEAIDDYLALRYVPGPYSLIRDIRKFPPAHYMIWRNQKAVFQRYWSPDNQETWSGDSYDALNAFEHIFDESTRLRMISERPVGAFLSGGLDSTAIVASLMKQFLEQLKTFSVGFGWKGDELSAAAKTAKRLGCEHHEIMCHNEDTSLLPRIIWHLDEPVGDGIILPMYLLSRLASENVTVVQSGEGADEILGGYFMHRVLWLATIYARWMPSWMQDKGVLPIVKRLPVKLLNKIFDYPGELGHVGKQRLVEFLRILRHESTAGQYRFIISLFLNSERKSLYTKNFLSALGAHSRKKSRKRLLDFNKMLDMQFEDWLPDDILCKQDKITMSCSLEGRVPFMDHKLVELVQSFPAKYKLGFKNNKVLLRRYLVRNGIGDVAKRRKVPFYIPIDQYMSSGPLKIMIDELLSEPSVRRRGIFKWESIRQMRITSNNGSFLYGKQLFSLTMLEMWFRIFIDQEAGWI